MEVTILERDIVKATAKMQFTHNGVTHVDNYSLKMIVPGTDRILDEYGLEFTEQLQQKAIDKITAVIQREIEGGILKNPLV
jgi:hypothetical protein